MTQQTLTPGPVYISRSAITRTKDDVKLTESLTAANIMVAMARVARDCAIELATRSEAAKGTLAAESLMCYTEMTARACDTLVKLADAGADVVLYHDCAEESCMLGLDQLGRQARHLFGVCDEINMAASTLTDKRPIHELRAVYADELAIAVKHSLGEVEPRRQ